MRIKSLLLGSAAAMVAVSGAQAADAIVVEPEPVEYVRVCDTYGAGFFYIPGTETCMRWSGYIRSSYSHLEITNTALVGAPVALIPVTTTFATERWRNRARLILDTRNETDWGTLRAWARLQANTTPGGGPGAFANTQAMITIAGFRVGHAFPYWVTNHGFGWVNASEAGQFAGPTGASAADAGWYGSPGTDNLFDYTWSGDGISITAGIASGVGFAGGGGVGVNRADYYVGFNYSGDGWGAAGTYLRESLAGGVDNDNWKLSVNFDLSEFIPGGTIQGQYMNAENPGGRYLNGFEDLWRIGFQMSPTDNTEFFVTYSDGEGFAGTFDATHWAVGINWYPVDGLKLMASYYRGDYESNVAGNLATLETDAFMIGARRSF